VVEGLQELLVQDQISLQVFAAEILGKGYESWRAYIGEKNHSPIILRVRHTRVPHSSLRAYLLLTRPSATSCSCSR